MHTYVSVGHAFSQGGVDLTARNSPLAIPKVAGRRGRKRRQKILSYVAECPT